MGICTWCGTAFPKTRATRKYCTPRCKTNACLGRKPSRLRAADVQALYAIVDSEWASVEALRQRLQSILGVETPPVPLSESGTPLVPGLD